MAVPDSATVNSISDWPDGEYRYSLPSSSAMERMGGVSGSPSRSTSTTHRSYWTWLRNAVSSYLDMNLTSILRGQSSTGGSGE